MTGVHSIDATGLLTPFASSTRRWTINNASLAKTNVKVKVKMGPKRSESPYPGFDPGFQTERERLTVNQI
jgi:hypothetical protein